VYSSVMLTVLWLAIFRGFDARRAFLLPPRDIGAPERVRTETGQIAALDRCRPPRSLPDAGIPQRQGAAFRQGEDPLLRVRAFRRGLEAVAFNEISQRKRRFLVFDFGSSMSSRQLRCTMRQTPLCKIHMWCSSGLQLDVRPVIRGEGKSSKRLVDLVRFELTTSSMPFKKYQSLTGHSGAKQRT
jgi:hypothetical protein